MWFQSLFSLFWTDTPFSLGLAGECLTYIRFHLFIQAEVLWIKLMQNPVKQNFSAAQCLTGAALCRVPSSSSEDPDGVFKRKENFCIPHKIGYYLTCQWGDVFHGKRWDFPASWVAKLSLAKDALALSGPGEMIINRQKNSRRLFWAWISLRTNRGNSRLP